MPLVEKRATFSPQNTATMVDTIVPEAHVPGMARELRNIEQNDMAWAPRRAWARLLPDNATPTALLPCTTIIGEHPFYDTAGRKHRVVLGVITSNAVIYHLLGENPTSYTLPDIHLDTAWQWDTTYRCSFAQQEDRLFISFWQPPEQLTVPPAGAQNLRLEAMSDLIPGNIVVQVYGVSLPDPPAALTLTAVNGGAMPPNAYNYFYTYKDADTGWESDRSPIASITLSVPVAPDQAPVAADAGVAGNVPTGTREYALCFRSIATGVASELSMPRQYVTDAPGGRRTLLTNLRNCPTGAVTKELYYREAGGAYHLLATPAGETYTDNTAAVAGAAYAQGAQNVSISAIGVYGGGGTPANGRNIYRCIYRQDGDGTWKRLTGAVAEFLENTTTGPLVDNHVTAGGSAWSRAVRIPLCGIVAEGPDNRVLWLNDKNGGFAARAYPTASADMPEALRIDTDGNALPIMAGTNDDPITACKNDADGWVVAKRKSYHFITRECTNCSQIIRGHGNVGPNTLIVLDGIVAALSADGPGYIDYRNSKTWRFIGNNPEQFCLSKTWETAVKERLPYATVGHYPRHSLVLWAFQVCRDWSKAYPGGPFDAAHGHNDLTIVWDYSTVGYNGHDWTGGKVWLMDFTGLDVFAQNPQPGGASDLLEAGFAYGVLAKMFDGEHNDGTVGVLSGQVQSVNQSFGHSTIVEVLTSDLGGQNVIGSIFWGNGGAATRKCRVVNSCENRASLIIGQNPGSGGTTMLTLQGMLYVNATSLFEIGGWQTIGPDMDLNTGLPMSIKKLLTLDLLLKG